MIGPGVGPSFYSGVPLPFPGATFGADFTTNRGQLNGTVADITALPGWTFTRASTGYAETVAGTLTSFASGAPRITDKGLLVEEARTNYALRSQEVDNASWTKTNMAVTANDTVAPDGTTTADKIYVSAAAGGTTTYQNVTMGAGTTITASIYAKKGTGATTVNEFGIRDTTGAVTYLVFTVNYDTLAVTYSTGSSGVTVTALANGWIRIQMTLAWVSGNTCRVYCGYATGTRTINDYAYIWGLQVEVGAFATSYIPTTTASATRAADVATITGLSTLLASDFTLIIDAAISSGSGGATSFVGDTGSAERFGTFRSGGTTPTAQSRTGGASTNATFAVSSGDVVIKSAHASFAASSRASITGAAVQALAANRPTGMHTLIVGALATSSTWLNGYVRKAILYPRAFSDAELQAASL